MDKHLVWKEEYNIGVDFLDKEHQELFEIINELFAMKEGGKNAPKEYQEGINYLKEHMLKHFTDEEQYMMSIGFEETEMHKRIHRGFQEKMLPMLEKEMIMTGYAPDAIDHFLGVYTGWLIGHTLTEDQAITGNKIDKWTDLLPKEQLAAMKKVMVKLLHSMFQLEAKIDSETYDGEQFRKGVYYRLVYGTEQDQKKSEIILVFEEKLLINTVGKIMGIHSDKLDVILVNAARYTAKQFVWHIMQHFPSWELSELKEENLLTYDQFQKVIEEGKPQVSLLFSTNEGYFAYCVIAPHLLKDGIGKPIEANNAMTVIEKYLTKREESSKPKVLVVDDSITIRQGMKNILGNEYEVSLVKSGVSAIRAITLDRPDLVLLDYDMPICNGRHVLEMLRSEEEFADIPVFFLTSRGDPKSVKKVLELKPEGYLLKYLKPVEVKIRIDEYFKRKKG